MKIQCEHCGAMIDIDKDKKCTNCGAPYKNNKEYEKIKELKHKHYENEIRNEEADIQRKEYQNEMMKKAPKTLGAFMLIPVFIFVVVVGVVIFMFVNFSRTTTNIINQTTNTEKDTTENITVSFNELATTKSYDIICDEVILTDSMIQSNNNKTIGLHIIAKNKTDSILQLYNFKLTYTDQNGNTDIVAKTGMPKVEDAFNTLNLYVEKGYSASGYIYYEIPKYVNDVELHFGKLLIKINKIDEIKK